MKVFSKSIRERNIIHPTAIVEVGVYLGEGNDIGPYCVIYSGTTIGDNNRFESHCSIGSPAEHRDYMREEIMGCGVTIGNNNIFREFVTINRGTTRETVVGNNVIMLRGSHLGHDVIVEDKVTLSCNVLIGGESHIQEGVNCGLGAVVHQYSILGAYSMIGMNSTVTKSTKVIPGEVLMGSPAKCVKENTVGLERNNISDEMITDFYDKYLKLLK